jgi:hypothetical protein
MRAAWACLNPLHLADDDLTALIQLGESILQSVNAVRVERAVDGIEVEVDRPEVLPDGRHESAYL